MTPLTFQQQWLWNLLRRHAGWNCLLPFALRISGALQPDLLRRSFVELIERHEALRTRFLVIDRLERQCSSAACENQFERASVADTAGSSGTHAQARLLVEDFFRQGLDLAAGPPFKIKLLQLNDREHVLAVAMHHLVSDGFSASLLFRELWLLYGELVHGQPSPLSRIPMQYAEYALWQHETNCAWQQKHAPYWESRLATAQRLQMPADECGPARGCAGMQLHFDAPLSGQLLLLARQAGTRPAMVMLTVCVAVMAQWSRQKDFVLAFNVVGRHRPEHEHMIGYFPYFLLLRMQLQGDETFMALLRHVVHEFQQAYAHQDFGRLAARLPDLPRALFQWLPWMPDELDGIPSSAASRRSGVEVERFHFDFSGRPAALVDIAIQVADTPAGLCASFGYRADLFPAKTMDRLAQDLRTMSERFVRDPYARDIFG